MYPRHCLPAHTEHELTVSGSDSTKENAPISHFSKVVKNLSRAASPQGPHWCILKDWDSSVCIWFRVFSAAVRESQLWENCKRERRDELLGLLKSCQKPFLSVLCPTDIHLASWKVETAKTSGLKRTFQLLRGTLQQDWVFEKKKKTPETVGMEGTSRLRGMLKNQMFGKWSKKWMWHCLLVRGGSRHMQGVLILASFVCTGPWNQRGTSQ